MNMTAKSATGSCTGDQSVHLRFGGERLSQLHARGHLRCAHSRDRPQGRDDPVCGCRRRDGGLRRVPRQLGPGHELQTTGQLRLVARARAFLGIDQIELHESAVDNLGIPKPKITYSVDKYVFDGAREAQAVIHRIFDGLGVPRTKEDREFSNLDNNVYTGSGHVMGTTKMGASSTDSVVDADCRAHDHGNLFIVGGSVFPTGAAVNPTLMTAALALRLAEKIKSDFGKYA